MNSMIRDYARLKKVKLWQVAEKLGLHDSNFSRKLRHELSEEETEQIIKIIDDLSIEHEKGGDNND